MANREEELRKLLSQRGKDRMFKSKILMKRLEKLAEKKLGLKRSELSDEKKKALIEELLGTTNVFEATVKDAVKVWKEARKAFNKAIEDNYVGWTFSVTALSFLASQSFFLGVRFNRGYRRSEDYDLGGHKKEKGHEEKYFEHFRKYVEDVFEGSIESFEIPFADRVPAVLPTGVEFNYFSYAGKGYPAVMIESKRKIFFGLYHGVGESYVDFGARLLPTGFDVFNVSVEGRIDAVLATKYGPVPIEFKPYWKVEAEHVRQARYYALILNAPFALLCYLPLATKDAQWVIVDWKYGYRSVSLEELRRLLGYEPRGLPEGLSPNPDGLVFASHLRHLRYRRRFGSDKHRNA